MARIRSCRQPRFCMSDCGSHRYRVRGAVRRLSGFRVTSADGWRSVRRMVRGLRRITGVTSALTMVHDGMGRYRSTAAASSRWVVHWGFGRSTRLGGVVVVAALLVAEHAAGIEPREQMTAEGMEQSKQPSKAIATRKDFVLRKPKGRPQGNLGLTVGVLGRSEGEGAKLPAGVWNSTRAHLGLRGDVIFGRKSAFDWGVGPFGEVMTAFDDISVGTGATVHVPVHRVVPLLVSAGGYGRYGGQWSGGLSGQLFWGVRGYKDDSWYVGSLGLLAQGRFGVVGQQKERSILIALQLDLAVLFIPVAALISVTRGS